MTHKTYENRLLSEKKNALSKLGFSIEIIPTANAKSTDRWIILSKDEIHITHRLGDDILNNDRLMYHCLQVMEGEYKKYKQAFQNDN